MPRTDITGLILAGGRARRMGGVDKGLVELAGTPMVSHAVSGLASQVGKIIINANRNREDYQQWSSTVVEDKIGEYAGPLAGIASGLQSADTEFVLTLPCDSPLIAHDYADRMYAQLLNDQAEIAVASDGNRLQPVFLLLRRDLFPSIKSFLSTGDRKIDRWFDKHIITVVDFSDKPETFLNINTTKEKDELVSRYYADV